MSTRPAPVPAPVYVLTMATGSGKTRAKFDILKKLLPR